MESVIISAGASAGSAVKTTCPYCGVGCGVSVSGGEVNGTTDHPANRGRLCIKGTHLSETLVPDGRLHTPLINGEVADWPQAIERVAGEFCRVIDEHGPDAIAFYLSGQLLTEDYYVANKLMKGFIGSANVDTNSRLCMASAVAAHKRAFGEDVVPCSYADLEQCDLLVLTGSNAAWAHPVLYQRIESAQRKRGTKVVVIDPRRTSTCDMADLHLPVRAGSDLALFNGLLSYLIETDSLDHDFITGHTQGFAAARQISRLDVQQVAAYTGLSAQHIRQFYDLFAAHPATVTMFSQGINQSATGTDKANAIINCHLATGRIGRAGCGPFSITGQPNAMGGREVGGMANQLAAHMDFSAANVDLVQRFWRAPKMADAPGLKAVDMFQALDRGDIKAIWIMGTNPAVSLPDANLVRRALAACPFVVVSDCIRQTDTNNFANVLLPAQGWGEKEGTVTNSERCISRQRRIVEPFGAARPDWQIICAVAGKMGYRQAFEYTGVADIFAEHARLSGYRNNGQRLFDISALAELTADAYQQLEPTHWPMHKRPFQDGQFSTPDGKAQFVAVPVREPVKQTHSATALILNSGRSRDQWHTMSRTGLSSRLFNHAFAPQLQIHPADAQRLDVSNGDLLQIENSYGSLRLTAALTHDTQPGYLFAPIHWQDQFSFRANINQVVAPVTDPVSGQPQSKHAVVHCRKVDVGYWLRLVTRTALQPQDISLITGIQYWTGSPVDIGWQYEMAMGDVQPLVQQLDHDSIARYADSQGGWRMLGRHSGQSCWLLFAHARRRSLPPLAHIAGQLSASHADWQKLSLCALEQRDNSAVICSCHEVREAVIRQQINQGAVTLAALGAVLKCGTNCGSCIPELNRLLTKPVAPARLASA